MAKTYTDLWKELVSFDSLYAAYLATRKGRRRKIGVMEFEADLEGNLIQLQNELVWRSYRPGGYHSFYVYEPKKRKITALTQYRDRIVQQAIFTLIEPIWESRFISNSYACRVGKGTHAAANKVQSMLKDCLVTYGVVHALKADISRFFASIDHEILKRCIKKRISDHHLLDLIDMIIDGYSEPDTPGVGIPIGNLTSQLFANVYLDELDQWAKCRRREKWYARYMDDFVFIHPEKKHLQALLLDAQEFLGRNLALDTNHKTQVFPVAVRHGRGLDFVGYHLWPHKRRLRRSSVARISRNVRRLSKLYGNGSIDNATVRSKILSYANHARSGDAIGAVEKILSKTTFTRRST
jgi:retron-type reverse transcriptase